MLICRTKIMIKNNDRDIERDKDAHDIEMGDA